MVRKRLEDFGGLRYVEVDKSNLSRHYLSHWGETTHIVPCSNCGVRMAKDPMRDLDGSPIPEEAFAFKEDMHPVCDSCIEAENNAEVVALLESKLGLTEKDRDALSWTLAILERKG